MTSKCYFLGDVGLKTGDYVRFYEDGSYIVFDADGRKKSSGKMEQAKPVDFEVNYCPTFFGGVPKGFKAWD